jgi:peptidoglycan/LPS O-acetylase OafA/YrhL
MDITAEAPARLPARFPTLDGLRGIAIVLVISHQFNRLVGSDLPTRIADHVLGGGWTGVQLFFVLSGFLITGVLLDGRGSPHYFGNFYMRRALRIFPIYYAALLLFVIGLPALGILPPEWRERQFALWLYVSNWPFGESKVLPHFWSLAVEEQFYLFWPLVVYWRGPRAMLRVCLVLAGVSLLARVAMVADAMAPLAIYENSLSRMDALVAGGAVAALLRMPGWLPRIRESRLHARLPILLLAALALEIVLAFKQYDPLGQTIGYSLLSALFAVLILAAACGDADGGDRSACARFLRSAPLRALGKYSYGMYIFHKPMSDLLGDPLLASLGYAGGLPLGPQVLYLIVVNTSIFLVGMLSYGLFERHFLALKPRFAPRSPSQRESQ